MDELKKMIDEKLYRRMWISFIGGAVAILAALISLTVKDNQFLIPFCVLCTVVVSSYGAKFVGPVKKKDYIILHAYCSGKENGGIKRKYREFFFDSPEYDEQISIKTSDKKKFAVKRHYILVFAGNNATMNTSNLLLILKDHEANETQGTLTKTDEDSESD